MRILTGELKTKINETVTVAGWVNSRRDHGGLIFIDLRDHQGIIQLVITPENQQAFALAETLRDEFVISATGLIRERATDLKNPNIETGDIELVVESMELLNRSDTPPVNTHDDGPESGEELRLKYRYLDLRRPSMQNTLKRRAKFYSYLRNYMDQHDFIEVTTPILANSSPEGARDFLVPSRLKPGLFYALPQAPQQFKQLLMVGGLSRYYQIAPCFRDEDPRADRLYGDFYQLDCEMSFVDSGETVRQTVEPLIKSLVTDFAGKKLLSEDIPRIPYQEAMEKYGVDKPDLRYGMEMIELTEILKNTSFKVFQSPCVKAIRVENGASLTRSQIDLFTEKARKLGASGLAYIMYENGTEKVQSLSLCSLKNWLKLKKPPAPKMVMLFSSVRMTVLRSIKFLASSASPLPIISTSRMTPSLLSAGLLIFHSMNGTTVSINSTLVTTHSPCQKVDLKPSNLLPPMKKSSPLLPISTIW